MFITYVMYISEGEFVPYELKMVMLQLLRIEPLNSTLGANEPIGSVGGMLLSNRLNGEGLYIVLLLQQYLKKKLFTLHSYLGYLAL